MRCLVLGANGFIGQHLVKKLLLNSNTEVATYDRKDCYMGNSVNGREPQHIQGDFINEDRWPVILKDFDICYHLVSTHTPRSSNEQPILDINNNLVGTLRLMEAMKALDTRIVFASSGGTVYGTSDADFISETHPTNPLCSYGITKLSIEKYLYLYHELHGVNSISLRIANPFGPGQRPNSSQGAVAVFMGRIVKGQAIDIWGNGSVVRDYIYIDDVINALEAVSKYRGRYHIFNIGSGRATSLLELVHEIEVATGRTAVIDFHQPRGFDVHRNVLDIQLAHEELSWKPVSNFNSSLIETFNWLKTHSVK